MKKGERQSVPQSNGYSWLYVYGFVHPWSGKCDLLRFDSVDVASFNAALQLFKARVDPQNEAHIALYIDNAGWHHSKKVKCPEGIELMFSLPYTALKNRSDALSIFPNGLAKLRSRVSERKYGSGRREAD